MIDCFSHISTEERARRYSETRSRSNVSGAYAGWKTLIKRTFFNWKTVPLTEGWYQNISLLPVPRTDSLNSLAEVLLGCEWWNSQLWGCDKSGSLELLHWRKASQFKPEAQSTSAAETVHWQKASQFKPEAQSTSAAETVHWQKGKPV